MWEIFKKELIHKFYSLTAYVLYSLALFFIGVLTYSGIVIINRLIPYISYYGIKYDIMDLVISPLFNDLGFILLFVIPIVTMTTFSLEKKTGTLELLLTYPVSDWGIVLGKFLANFLVISVIPIAFMVVILTYSKFQIAVDQNVLWTAFLGVLLLIALAVAFGNFFSSLTDSVFISSILTFIFLLFLWIIGTIADYGSGSWATIAKNLSILNNLSSFTKGVIDMKNVAYFLGGTLLALYLNVATLESRYWTGE